MSIRVTTGSTFALWCVCYIFFTFTCTASVRWRRHRSWSLLECDCSGTVRESQQPVIPFSQGVIHEQYRQDLIPYTADACTQFPLFRSQVRRLRRSNMLFDEATIRQNAKTLSYRTQVQAYSETHEPTQQHLCLEIQKLDANQQQGNATNCPRWMKKKSSCAQDTTGLDRLHTQNPQQSVLNIAYQVKQ